MNVTAEGGDAGLAWNLSSSKIALTNKARGVSASNALIQLSGTGETVEGEVRVSSFDAGYGLPTFTLNGTGRINGGKLAAQLNAITGAGGGVKLGGIKLSGNLNTRSYTANLDMGPVTIKLSNVAESGTAGNDTLAGGAGGDRPVAW